MGGMQKKGGYMSKAGKPMDLDGILKKVPLRDARAKVSLSKFLTAVKDRDERENVPVHWTLVSAEYKARAAEKHILLKAVFKVSIQIDDHWTSVPVLPSNVCVENADVECEENTRGLFWFGVVRDQYSLLTIKKGDYIVSVDCLVEYATDQKRGFSVDKLPEAGQTSVQVTVDSPSVDIKVDPSYDVVNSVEHGATTMACRVPPSAQLAVTWTPREEDEEAEAAEAAAAAALKDQDEEYKEKMVSGEQSLGMLLGEGVLATHAQIRYDIVNDARSVFEINARNAGRVLSVKGKSINHWEVVDGDEKQKDEKEKDPEEPKPYTQQQQQQQRPRRRQQPEPGPRVPLLRSAAAAAAAEEEEDDDDEEARSDDAGGVLPDATSQVIRVVLDYAAEGRYDLDVHTEVPMTGTTAKVRCPSFVTQEVNREKGVLAIAAKTSVEIDELDSSVGLQAGDPSDFKEYQHLVKDNSVSLCYKYLSPSYGLSLQVTRHTDADVLVAAATDCEMIATYTPEGKVIHHVKLQLRNTQRQYLRATLPKESEIWSVSVDDEPVKPAEDKEGKIMVPLVKSFDASNRCVKQKKFLVAFTFVSLATKLPRKGSLDIGFCSVDVPINVLSIYLYLPKAYNYGEFRGNIREVERLSHYAIPPPLSRRRGGAGRGQREFAQVQMAAPRMKSAVAFPSFNLRSKKKAGALPVMVDETASGERFLFERLLVNEEAMQLSVDFRKRRKLFKRRA